MIGRSMRMAIERLWSLLPDRCQMPDCSRQGVRGNENVIDGKRVCDYCHAKMRTPYWRLGRDYPERSAS